MDTIRRRRFESLTGGGSGKIVLFALAEVLE